MLENLLVTLLFAGCGFWVAVLISVLYNIRTVPRIENLRSSKPASWPGLAIIVPACNEGDTIEKSMELRLRETYPNVKFVVIDDRSTDDTGAIADRVAAGDPRFLVVHNTELPEGWLGKVHALHKGVEATDSDWILFTDADVHIQPGTLERVVAWCEERKLDQVAVLPRVEAENFAVRVLYAFFARMSMVGPGAIHMVESPKVRLAAGVGAFNLFRRSALERSPGVPRLRLEVIDDMGLAFMLKAYGAKCSVLDGTRFVSLSWYTSLRAMKRGFEKNGFAVLSYSVPVMVTACLLMVLFEWLPFIAVAWTGHPALQILGVIAYLCAVGATAAAGYKNQGKPAAIGAAFFYPLGALTMSYFLARSGVLALWRKGIVWRGTLYPLKDLRAFRRWRPEREKADGT